jgi:hypothetical protein
MRKQSVAQLSMKRLVLRQDAVRIINIVLTITKLANVRAVITVQAIMATSQVARVQLTSMLALGIGTDSKGGTFLND